MKFGKKAYTRFYIFSATLLVLVISLLAYAPTSAAPTTLAPNDVVIVTANSDTSFLATACATNPNSNAVDLLLRRDIGAGTVIKVTDNPWGGSSFTNNNEGTITYTAPTDLPAGTVITYNDCEVQTAGSDWVRAGSFDAAAASGDTLLVYQGTTTAPSFIYGFAFRTANWIASGTITSANSRIPAALATASPQAYATGTTARNYQYTIAGNYGIYSADFLTHLRNMANWATTGGASTGTQFGPTAVPFDATRPTFNDVERYSPATEQVNASSVKFRITTSEPVQTLPANAFTVATTGSLAYGLVTTIAIDSSTYEITVTGITGDGTIALDQFVGSSLLDARGNPSVDTTFISEVYTVDTTPLTASISRRAAQPAYTQANSAWFTLTLSEDIVDTSLTISDIALGTTTGTVAALNKISETEYEFQVTGMTSGDFVSATIAAGTITDLAGNGNIASTSSQNVVTYDGTAPVITVNSVFSRNVSLQLTGTVDDPTAVIRVTLMGIEYAAINNGDGTWSLPLGTITPSPADGTYDVTATATDLAGNIGTDASSAELVIDTVAPTGTLDALAPTIINSPALTGTVDDPAAIIRVTVNGIHYTATNNGNGTWILPAHAISPGLPAGGHSVSVRFSDQTGNSSSTHGTLEILRADADLPTVLPVTWLDGRPTVMGTYDSDNSQSLTVVVNGISYVLGTASELTAVGDDWELNLSNLSTPLAGGTYNVTAQVSTRSGALLADVTTDELIIQGVNLGTIIDGVTAPNTGMNFMGAGMSVRAVTAMALVALIVLIAIIVSAFFIVKKKRSSLL